MPKNVLSRRRSHAHLQRGFTNGDPRPFTQIPIFSSRGRASKRRERQPRLEFIERDCHGEIVDIYNRGLCFPFMGMDTVPRFKYLGGSWHFWRRVDGLAKFLLQKVRGGLAEIRRRHFGSNRKILILSQST